jgi:hypothetical protein
LLTAGVGFAAVAVAAGFAAGLAAFFAAAAAVAAACLFASVAVRSSSESSSDSCELARMDSKSALSPAALADDRAEAEDATNEDGRSALDTAT